VRCRFAPNRSACAREGPLEPRDSSDTAESSSNADPLLARRSGPVVLPLPGVRRRSQDRIRSSSIASRSAEPFAENVLLPDELASVCGPHPQRERRDLWQPLLGCV